MYTAKNHSEGPDKTVIGGTLTIEAGAIVEGIVSAPVIDALTSTSATSALSANQGKALSDIITAKTAAAQVDSVASTIAALVIDFNALLTKLRTAGIIGV